MAKKRVKKRTHVGAKKGSLKNAGASHDDPKSMVIRIGAGEVGPSVSQLAHDVRNMMEPGTASRLRVLLIPRESSVLAESCIGTKRQSPTGLYHHGRSLGSHPSTAVFQITRR